MQQLQILILFKLIKSKKQKKAALKDIRDTDVSMNASRWPMLTFALRGQAAVMIEKNWRMHVARSMVCVPDTWDQEVADSSEMRATVPDPLYARNKGPVAIQTLLTSRPRGVVLVKNPLPVTIHMVLPGRDILAPHGLETLSAGEHLAAEFSQWRFALAV